MSHNLYMNALVIYGGKCENSQKINNFNQFIYNNLDILQLHNLTWINVINRSNSLEAKAAHSMVSYESQLYIFGGYNTNGLISNHFQIV
jgi:hypothetical protein